MDYTIPDWDSNQAQVIGTTRYRKHTVTTYRLPDVKPVLGVDDPVIIEVYYHQPNRPMLVAHPVVGSTHNEVATFFAKLFCLLGWNATIVHRARHPMEGKTPEEFEQLCRHLVYHEIEVSQFLEKKGLATKEKTLAYGASLGGVTTALMPATVPYKGYVCIVTGGSLPEVMCGMDAPPAEEWRNRMISDNGYSGVAELQQQLSASVETDTLKLARPRAHMLLFSGLFDRIVPAATQERLRRAYGFFKPAVWLPAGHTTVLLFLPVILPIMVVWAYFTIYLRRMPKAV